MDFFRQALAKVRKVFSGFLEGSFLKQSAGSYLRLRNLQRGSRLGRKEDMVVYWDQAGEVSGESTAFEMLLPASRALVTYAKMQAVTPQSGREFQLKTPV